MRRIFLIDCPGVVYPSEDSESDIVLKGVVSFFHFHLLSVCCFLWPHPNILSNIHHSPISGPGGEDPKPRRSHQGCSGASKSRIHTENLSHPILDFCWGFLGKTGLSHGKTAQGVAFDCGRAHSMLKYNPTWNLFTWFFCSKQAQSYDTFMHASKRSKMHTRVGICLSGYVGFYSWLLMKTCF